MTALLITILVPSIFFAGRAALLLAFKPLNNKARVAVLISGLIWTSVADLVFWLLFGGAT